MIEFLLEVIEDEGIELVKLSELGLIGDSTDQAGIYVALYLLGVLPEFAEFIIILIDIVL